MTLRNIAGASVAAMCAAAVLSACSEEAQEAQILLTPVTVETVVARDFEDRIEATGQLLAVERAEIAAEVDGQITELVIDEGSTAAKGEVILKIDPQRRRLERDTAAALAAEARAAVHEQQREFERVQELHDRKVASQTRLDQAQTALSLARSRYEAATARLGGAERSLADASVRAPFSGSIAARFVSRGEYVSSGTKLVEVVALDPIEVEFRLTEIDSSRVALDQTVAVRVASRPGEVFQGKVNVVSPVIDERSRTLRVKARLDNAEARLQPGLFARVDLGIAHREGVVMIPEDAILQRSDGAVVYRANSDDRVERVVIVTGAHHDGKVEVVRGLTPGEQIVTRGHFRLTDGQLVSRRTPSGAPVEAANPKVAVSPDRARQDSAN